MFAVEPSTPFQEENDMRKTLVLAIAATTALGLGTIGIAGASVPAKKPPVKLDGKVTNKGTATVKDGAIEIEADDFFFDATFIKAKKGKTVSVTVKNEGSAPHTFTADDGSFDEQVSPGAEATVEVTIPANGKPVSFHCDFHASSGMKGAFFNKAGAKASTSGRSGSSGSSGGGGGYGY
jgi:plastocyanin